MLLVFGAVAVGSFTINMHVVRNTPWVKDVLQGVPMGIEGQEGLRSNAGQVRFGCRKGCDPDLNAPSLGRRSAKPLAKQVKFGGVHLQDMFIRRKPAGLDI